MTSPYGARGHIGIAKESVWGTAVAATEYFEALSESIVTTIERFESRNIVGNINEPDDEAGLHRHAGDLVLAANPQNVGHLIKGALGVNSVTVILSGFLHRNDFTFTNTDAGSLSALPAYTLELARGGIATAFRYAGVQFGTLAFNVVANQELRVTAGAMAKARSVIARTTPTFPGSPLAPFTFKTTSLSLAGAAAEKFQSFNLSIDNQLEGVPFLNASDEIAAIRRNGPALMNVSGTVEFADHDDADRFINQTEYRLFAHWTLADSFSLLIDLPRVVTTEYPLSVPGRERITVDFVGKARFHTGSDNAGIIRLTTVSSIF